ncbi:hypothetical protein F4780DRAFT_197306 [Xylariomycetidae sp. FL0641]|nr:hypothetical protein F4780DRAFT_197306 [Xylariomycetidae sp. FL0641]
MSSIYTVSPASLHDLRDPIQTRRHPPHLPEYHSQNHLHQAHTGPATPVESHLLSPHSSYHFQSNSTSPTGNANTPADTLSTVDCYQPSEAFSGSELADDPFFGANFDDADFPPFVGEPETIQDSFLQKSSPAQDDDRGQYASYPLSPHKTPSIPTNGHFARIDQAHASDSRDSSLTRDNSIQSQSRPSEHLAKFKHPTPQLTPETKGGSFSSDDSLAAPIASTMTAQSPRVTVSLWNKGEDTPIQGIERAFGTDPESPRTSRAPHSIAGDLVNHRDFDPTAYVQRANNGTWVPDIVTGHRGLGPGERPAQEVPTPNEQAAHRDREDKNREVYAWVSRPTSRSAERPESIHETTERPYDGEDNIPTTEIRYDNLTENRHLPGQTYIQVDAQGGLNPTDLDILRRNHRWEDGPTIHAIHQPGDNSYFQPQTSQAAIEKFNQQCQDNESVISAAATWGTRRRSFPSVLDMDAVTSGNIFKKLSISNTRRPSFIKKFPISLPRRPSASMLKRKGSNLSELFPEEPEEQGDRRGSHENLKPARTSSWGIKQKPTPSINTALVGMGTGVASIGTTHARSGSVSANPVTSPKSPFASLSVPTNLRRQRSKTEITKKPSPDNLIGMLRKQGGPPVARLAQSQPTVRLDDDDDDDDDGLDEADMKAEAHASETIVPTFQGFRDHVVRLNPQLARSDETGNPSNYLVDRIAHQMIIRYKQLQQAKIKHISHVDQAKCSNGRMCIALGGSAIPLDNKGAVDPPGARHDSSDGDSTPLEGTLNTESFPSGIPMPPTATLPAEFECQLCFTSKKFQKPSDWTKHVHEDVQPFTCTWERCREPKMFKRKADWVRHENEGHRHLEWWKCDVDDCSHVCYRRDNFLQHLVREHKFAEPKVKTKAAIKKAGGSDMTWQKVEQCHSETGVKPQEEPCRFCGKTFPTWKKLTVHLAKHMEHISLPVLKLIATKQLSADTVISPVEDPPPRAFGLPPQPATSIKQELPVYSPPAPTSTVHTPSSFAEPQSTPSFMTPVPMTQNYYAQQQAPQQFGNLAHNSPSPLMMPTQYPGQLPFQNLPVATTSSFGAPGEAYHMNLQVHDTEPFPPFNSLGIQDPSGGMYDSLGSHTMHTMDQYGSNTGSASPYSHSPHPGHSGTFYNS